MTTIPNPTSESYRRRDAGFNISDILSKLSGLFGRSDDPREIEENQELADIVEKSSRKLPNLPAPNSDTSVLYSIGQIPSNMRRELNDYIKPMNGRVQIINRGSSRFLDTQVSTYEVIFYDEQPKAGFEAYVFELAKQYNVHIGNDLQSLVKKSYSSAA